MTNNRQRAAEIVGSIPELDEIAAALDAAEARGRAEVAAELRAVMTYTLSNDGEPLGTVVLADDLLALIADDTARTTSSRGPEPIADFPDGPDARDGTQ